MPAGISDRLADQPDVIPYKNCTHQAVNDMYHFWRAQAGEGGDSARGSWVGTLALMAQMLCFPLCDLIVRIS